MNKFRDDTTKPSRLNRRRKKRWKVSTIADLIHNGLTDCYRAAILASSSTLTTGFSSPESKGVKTPTHGVFLCLKKIATAKIRALSMTACRVQPHGWPEPLPGTANSLHAVAQCLAANGGGFASSVKDITVMTIQATGKIRLSIPTLYNKTRLAFDLPRPFKPRVLIYKTESGAFDIINQADGKHGVTAEQRAFMLDQIAAHDGMVGGAA